MSLLCWEILVEGLEALFANARSLFSHYENENPGFSFKIHKSFIDRTQEAFYLQNAFFVIPSRNPNYKSKAASVRILPAVPD